MSYNKHKDTHFCLETFSYSLIGYRYLQLSTNLRNPQISLLKLHSALCGSKELKFVSNKI